MTNRIAHFFECYAGDDQSRRVALAQVGLIFAAQQREYALRAIHAALDIKTTSDQSRIPALVALRDLASIEFQVLRQAFERFCIEEEYDGSLLLEHLQGQINSIFQEVTTIVPNPVERIVELEKEGLTFDPNLVSVESVLCNMHAQFSLLEASHSEGRDR
ncbi:MAG: hypothetical protein KDA52_05190 [Planctomycetaceae bacterium]|nr:hypothetical protein [Planctomycetaceae bacterium]